MRVYSLAFANMRLEAGIELFELANRSGITEAELHALETGFFDMPFVIYGALSGIIEQIKAERLIPPPPDPE